MAHRLPQPGGDNANWGDILNDFLSVELNGDGSLKRTPDITDAKAQVASGQIPTWSDNDWQWEPQSIGDILTNAKKSTTASNAGNTIRFTRVDSSVFATIEATASTNNVGDWPNVPVGYRPSYAQYPAGVGGVMLWSTNGWCMVRANPRTSSSDTNPTGWTIQKQDGGFTWS